MTTATYAVTGLTCEHCVRAVTDELRAVEGVDAVQVALHAGAVSTVTVSSAAPLADDQVEGALDEAGDYHLVQA
jgi:copper chaperone